MNTAIRLDEWKPSKYFYGRRGQCLTGFCRPARMGLPPIVQKLQSPSSLKKRIVFFLLGDCGQGTVSGANQGICLEGENLFPDFLFEEVGGLKAAANRAGEYA